MARPKSFTNTMCNMVGCESAAKWAGGLCGKHYKRLWRHNDANKTLIRERGKRALLVCAAEGCQNPLKSGKYCNAHSLRLLRRGTLEKAEITFDPARYKTIVNKHGVRKYEHIAVAEKAFGGLLPEGAVVHHINEDPRDNRPENLVICPNQAYHVLIHTLMRQKGISFKHKVAPTSS